MRSVSTILIKHKTIDTPQMVNIFYSKRFDMYYKVIFSRITVNLKVSLFTKTVNLIGQLLFY